MADDRYTELENKCSAVAEMGDRLATIDMNRKLGTVPFFWGGAGYPSKAVVLC